MSDRTKTREAVRGLRDDPELSRLVQAYPDGLPDRDSNDRVLREVVSLFQRGLAASAIPLRLRLEPFVFDPRAGVRSPTRLSILEGDVRRAVAVTTMENAMLIGDRLCVTQKGDDAVQRVAETLLHQIERAMGLSEGET